MLSASASQAAELLVALENARAREEELTRELAAAGIDVRSPAVLFRYGKPSRTSADEWLEPIS